VKKKNGEDLFSMENFFSPCYSKGLGLVFLMQKHCRIRIMAWRAFSKFVWGWWYLEETLLILTI